MYRCCGFVVLVASACGRSTLPREPVTPDEPLPAVVEPLPPLECTTSLACDDTNACTTDACVGGTCTHAVAREGPVGHPSCSDGLDNDCDLASDSDDSECAGADRWWDVAWTVRRKLSFANDAQDEDLFDFPVMVTLPTNGLSRDALRFVDDDGVTVLAHEVESWSTSAIVWVNVPQIVAASNTDFIWLYTNNAAATNGEAAAAVWSNGYSGAWHLGALPTSRIVVDSSPNHRHGLAFGTELPTIVDGLFGPAMHFDGLDQFVMVDGIENDSLAINGSTITIELWMRQQTQVGPDYFCTALGRQYQNDYRDNYAISVPRDPPDAINIALGADPYVTEQGTTPRDTWVYVTVVQDNGVIEIGTRYAGGSTVLTSAATELITDFNGTSFGGQENGGATAMAEYFTGDIDEVRIGRLPRSPAWLRAQYLAMTGQLVVIGPGEELTL